jgi:hypothetical protein
LRDQENGENYIMRSFMLCTLQLNVIQVIKSIIMRSAGNVASTGGEETCMHCFMGRPDRIHLEDEGTDGSIILKWIFKKWDKEA